MRRLMGQMDGTDSASSAVPIDARLEVDRLLRLAVGRAASDLHLEPGADGFEVRLRVDGLLETVSRVSAADGRRMVNRLMVGAGLLTYRLDVPQEGRAEHAVGDDLLEIRVSVMPTNHGLRAVVRLPAELIQPRDLDGLDLPAAARAGLEGFARSDSGMLVLCGPAGSGKTTTVYALLEHLVATSPGVSVVALEDPIERDLAGVTQIAVTPFGELTYERALRSMLRQDPQVLAVGEIRDSATASTVAAAALSGHRLVTTLHASTPAGAVLRLREMGLAGYQIAGALRGVMAVRLVRRRDGQGGYRGRAALASFGVVDEALRAAVVDGASGAELEAIFDKQDGYQTLRASGAERVAAGETDAAEVLRVLGSEKDGG